MTRPQVIVRPFKVPGELWVCMWGAMAYAIAFTINGRCVCGCTGRECLFCVHECYPVLTSAPPA